MIIFSSFPTGENEWSAEMEFSNLISIWILIRIVLRIMNDFPLMNTKFSITKWFSGTAYLNKGAYY